ncbi:MAG: hypothetical protein NUV61_03990 [Candidatus Azambacteria bacterium]|nr:hypothetical protein [Candidatus Azambacteria bacterium]
MDNHTRHNDTTAYACLMHPEIRRPPPRRSPIIRFDIPFSAIDHAKDSRDRRHYRTDLHVGNKIDRT